MAHGCPSCGKQYVRKGNFQRHWDIKHKQQQQQQQQSVKGNF